VAGQGVPGLGRHRGRLTLASGRLRGCLEEQQRDVVAELSPGMGEQAVQQLVGGIVKVGPPQGAEGVFDAEVLARSVARFQEAVGVEDQPVAWAYRESGWLDRGVQAERCRVRRGGQRLQIAGRGQPQRRRVPAADKLKPAARVEFSE
jgi:hypothetical protein